MAYNEKKLANLKALKTLAERVRRECAGKERVEALESRVNELAVQGGEPNVIVEVKVNGESQAVAGKAVDITVPVKASELENDAGYQSAAQVAAAIAAAGHAGFETAQAVPDAAQAKDNVLYLVMNEQTGHYDIYAKVGGEMALLDDTTVDLSGYVEKAEGKGLSSEDFTAALKAKLESLSAATDEEVAEMLSDVFAAQE